MEKPVLYRGKIVGGDGDVVELCDGRGSMPEPMNYSGNAAVCGIDMEKEEIVIAV